MSKLIKIDGEYANWIKDLSLRFKQSQIKAAIRVNSKIEKKLLPFELDTNLVRLRHEDGLVHINTFIYVKTTNNKNGN